ncbi:kelch-like protein 18 [Physella acuta]|uniref:kelch-like protein 18 n=1 Tax=Physella acuta TaxID=109671 RepID=UPI0027DE249C|nr:kelch-like protein 18 [Physella acuta]
MDAVEFCRNVFKSLENVWTNKLLCDVTVKVQDETFECHRLVLAVTSDFFLALFRSGMKEVTENVVVLHDMSSEAFHSILKIMYTGADVLTVENYIEVWRAAHQLQIQTIVQGCENFANRNITKDTWETLFSLAKCLQSERVLTELHVYMLKKFSEVCISPTFLQLPFEDIRELIKSQDLVVSSEDVVIESVIRWVTYDPKVKNERNDCTHKTHEDTSMIVSSENSVKLDTAGSRKVYLNKLLRKVRTCLVSPLRLAIVRKMDLVMEDRDSRDIIDYAKKYNAKEFRHCQCPSAALTRSCSGYIHAGVFADSTGMIKVINACNEKSYRIHKCINLNRWMQIVPYDGKLYAAGEFATNRNCYRMFVLSDNNWVQVKELSSLNLLLVSHADFIYILNKDEKIIYRMNPKKETKQLEKFLEFPENIVITHAMFLQNDLLLFGSDIQNRVDKTIVYELKISSKVFTRLDNLDGPAKHLISFKNDNDNYILQANGSLWIVLYSSHIGGTEFKSLAKLWNFTKTLYGALTFQRKLIIFGNNPNKDPLGEKKLNEIPDHFKCIRHVGTDEGNVSNFIPITIPRYYIL